MLNFHPDKFYPLLLALALSLPLVNAQAETPKFTITDTSDNDLTIEVMPADGSLLAIWFLDHDGERPLFDQLLKQLPADGIEVWKVDLIRDYFLPRNNENVRALPGDGVAAVIRAAHERTDKTLVLAAYDRMPLPVLRGIRQWQGKSSGMSRLAGALLFYPNLYGPPPVAGQDPVLDPIVDSTNVPVTIYQPMYGAHRWRLGELMNRLWQASSPAISIIVPDVRDWFFMHPPGRDPAEQIAATAVANNLPKLVRLMDAHPKPPGPAPLVSDKPLPGPAIGLIPSQSPKLAKNFELSDRQGNTYRLDDHRGKVILVNFWATWCPPCVEEIPSLNRLARHFSDQDFSVVSIDFRETDQAIRDFTDKIEVDYPILLDRDGLTSHQWKVFSFPSSYILDREGLIRYSVNKAIDWNTPRVRDIIDQLLNEPKESQVLRSLPNTPTIKPNPSASSP